MKITLIDYAGNGNENRRHAAEILVFTKQTRLKMSPGLLDDIRGWSDSEIYKELEYMSNTIPSSWEMIDYTFLIENCTRAFTHQLVRTRTNSYAQQTMRILDVSGFTYDTGPSIESNDFLDYKYSKFMLHCNEVYKELIDEGAAIEDARGILPTNIHTNIVVKMNLRTAAETVSKRTSIRTQGEYRDFVFAIFEKITDVHPWADVFLRDRKSDACNYLEKLVSELYESKIMSKDKFIDAVKQIDILRS